MEFLLASNNSHKRDEFVRLLGGHVIRMPSEAGIGFDFEEDGESFFQNAFGKAMALHETAGVPVIADDSGLCVDALDGEPGLYSSRFGSSGGALLDSGERNAFLLSRMRGVEDRKAHFVCCLVLVLGRDRFFTAQETVDGLITAAPRGAHGFGYDPLFLVPGTGKTIAELPDAEKDAISHRGRAARRILAMLENA
jgi:XTP/dITP diphosphohydrolase